MHLKNKDQLIENASSTIYAKLRKDCIEIIEASMNSVDPRNLISNKIQIDGDFLKISNKKYNLKKYERIFVIGGGKAGDLMAEAVEKILDKKNIKGMINVPYLRTKNKLEKIILNGASHPLPDLNGVTGVEKMLEFLKDLTENDLVICLISGGASSLMVSPVEEITLKEYQNIVNLLLKKGANIEDLNIVRKHIDKIKGGKLAMNCYPAEVISLILSDVIGDKLNIIGSGLTVYEEPNYIQAINILKKYEIWDSISINLQEYLLNQKKKEKNQIKNDYYLNHVNNFLIGNNLVAAEAGLVKAEELGYNSFILTTMLSGESNNVGFILTSIIKEIYYRNRPFTKPTAIIVGGETTVNVSGDGVGGRNQELVLAASSEISGIPCIISSIGTDGIDGISDAAGAIADGDTLKKAQSHDLVINQFLLNNDSNTFFNKIEDTLMTGYTGTNVNDLIIILINGV